MKDRPREEAQRLAEERDAARKAKDFAGADRLRDRIGELGFDLKDTPHGPELQERRLYETTDPTRIDPVEVTLQASVHVLYEGFHDDLVRFVEAFRNPGVSFEIVVTDNASPDGLRLEELAGKSVRILHFPRPVGWAESRNAAAKASRGEICVFADLSVEPQGEILVPLVRALADPSVGVCGPWGLVTQDLREFHQSPGPVVDAVEGYLLAVRREVFLETGFDPWFKWYRHADLDLSFRIRARGLEARIVGVPAVRHTHRGWTGVPETERPARSKRNFYRFLDHWKDRTDLLVGGHPA